MPDPTPSPAAADPMDVLTPSEVRDYHGDSRNGIVFHVMALQRLVRGLASELAAARAELRAREPPTP